MVVNLICSYNNVMFLLNFMCLVFLFVFVLFLFNLMNITLFMLLIYATLINLLFLVNGMLLMSSYNYMYYSLSSHFIINNYDISFNKNMMNVSWVKCALKWVIIYPFLLFGAAALKWVIIYPFCLTMRTIINYDISFMCASIINHNFNNMMIHISTMHFYNLCYLSSYSTLLNMGLNRLGHVMFDNSLFCLMFTMFFMNLINLNIMFLMAARSL